MNRVEFYDMETEVRLHGTIDFAFIHRKDRVAEFVAKLCFRRTAEFATFRDIRPASASNDSPASIRAMMLWASASAAASSSPIRIRM